MISMKVNVSSQLYAHMHAAHYLLACLFSYRASKKNNDNKQPWVGLSQSLPILARTDFVLLTHTRARACNKLEFTIRIDLKFICHLWIGGNFFSTFNCKVIGTFQANVIPIILIFGTLMDFGLTVPLSKFTFECLGRLKISVSLK